MEKIEITKLVAQQKFGSSGLSYDFIEIESIERFVEILKNNQATHIKFTQETDYDGDPKNVLIEGYIKRMETEDELSKRVFDELVELQKKEKAKEQSEKNTYERLKKKFEQ